MYVSPLQVFFCANIPVLFSKMFFGASSMDLAVGGVLTLLGLMVLVVFSKKIQAWWVALQLERRCPWCSAWCKSTNWNDYGLQYRFIEDETWQVGYNWLCVNCYNQCLLQHSMGVAPVQQGWQAMQDQKFAKEEEAKQRLATSGPTGNSKNVLGSSVGCCTSKEKGQ